ncbi:ornithine cyclodeaminase family protein [Novosphingobium sp. MMS21-SN21R]|uniref:ornithine cyclodeaminase family protein n=1 Tax=Novosphingobium sp. MMS21-SN21R TaxID=2969298 RepID=UPI0028855101|nr:ornithine cyclodeaminase family protein [Novosphingobium sp. MMS21-SN21R]MDT0510238.1 ornithine cyclodeaminase family protein [Novosphingobium sp. MMS21-SN21R]
MYAQPFGPGACPPRIVAQNGPSWLRALPSNPPGCRYFGAKLMGAAMNVGQPSVEYVIVLFDRETSQIAGFLDANLITAYRTAATSASAFDKLAPRNPLRLGVIGSGLEASMHTRAFSAMRDLSEVVVFSTTPARREAFAQTLSDELGIPVRPAATPQEAVGDADVVLTAARSHDETPILFADWLPEKAMVVSIGSTIPQQREIDISVIARADLIVCDMLEEVLHETGDMLAAVAAGIEVEPRAISLNDLMNGSAADRVAAAQRPMFKSVGGGVQDVVVGGAILDRAIAAGLAAPLPFQFEGKAL